MVCVRGIIGNEVYFAHIQSVNKNARSTSMEMTQAIQAYLLQNTKGLSCRRQYTGRQS